MISAAVAAATSAGRVSAGGDGRVRRQLVVDAVPPEPVGLAKPEIAERGRDVAAVAGLLPAVVAEELVLAALVALLPEIGAGALVGTVGTGKQKKNTTCYPKPFRAPGGPTKHFTSLKLKNQVIRSVYWRILGRHKCYKFRRGYFSNLTDYFTILEPQF